MLEQELKLPDILQQLHDIIFQRDIMEMNAVDFDVVLAGTMLLLRVLVYYFPSQKLERKKLILYLLDDCLF